MLYPKGDKMQISTKTGYALRAIMDLALRNEIKPVSLAEICRNQNLPSKYVEQLFRKLKKNGIVKSVQGVNGGYVLNQAVNKISLRDIMIAVDENLTTYCDQNINDKSHCSGLPCGFNLLWDEIKEHFDEYYNSIKLDKIMSYLRRTNV